MQALSQFLDNATQGCAALLHAAGHLLDARAGAATGGVLGRAPDIQSRTGMDVPVCVYLPCSHRPISEAACTPCLHVRLASVPAWRARAGIAGGWPEAI
jgi:hypothetical protein